MKLVDIIGLLMVAGLMILIPILNYNFAVVFYITLGVLARTWLPYFRKLFQGELLEFDVHYIYSAIGSLLFTLPTGLELFYTFQFPFVPTTLVEHVILLILAFLYGFGGDAMVKEGMKWYELIMYIRGKKKEEKEKEEEETEEENKNPLGGGEMPV